MHPTSKTRQAEIGEIGATQFCGDSGSLVGNEGNLGMDRSSSDDPAQQYALFSPVIFNPLFNKNLTKKHCIHVLRQDKLERVHEVEAMEPVVLADVHDRVLPDELEEGGAENVQREVALQPPVDKIVAFMKMVNEAIDVEKADFKFAAIDFISKVNNNDDLIRLFKQLKNTSHSFHERSMFNSRLALSFRSHVTTKTWADIVEVMQAQFTLNLMSAPNDYMMKQTIRRNLNDRHYRVLIDYHGRYQWISRSTHLERDLLQLSDRDAGKELKARKDRISATAIKTITTQWEKARNDFDKMPIDKVVDVENDVQVSPLSLNTQ